MKNIKSISVLFLLFTFVFSVSAQREVTAVTKNNPYDKMIHFLPLPLFVSGLAIGFEKPTSTKESFYMELGYYSSQNANALDIKDINGDFSDMNGLKFELQYRFYKKSNNYKKNIWISPFLNFKTISASLEETTSVSSGPPLYYTNYITTSDNKSASTISFGYMLGIRRAMMDNVYFDMSFGGGIFIPVAGDDHEYFNIPVFNPYEKAIQFKGSIGFCVAL
jgi:hypothetical protein